MSGEVQKGLTSQNDPVVVVTFSNTPDACAMEDAAKAHNIPGRLIPIPSAISAGCGLSWRADACDKEQVLSAIDHYGIAHEGVYDLDLLG